MEDSPKLFKLTYCGNIYKKQPVNVKAMHQFMLKELVFLSAFIEQISDALADGCDVRSLFNVTVPQLRCSHV